METDTNSSNKVYVANLPLQVDDAKLKEFFSTYGNVIDCKVIRNPITAKSKGFGFVTFESSEVAEKMKNLDLLLNGRKLKVLDAYRKQKDVMLTYHNGTTFYHYSPNFPSNPSIVPMMEVPPFYPIYPTFPPQEPFFVPTTYVPIHDPRTSQVPIENHSNGNGIMYPVSPEVPQPEVVWPFAYVPPIVPQPSYFPTPYVPAYPIVYPIYQPNAFVGTNRVLSLVEICIIFIAKHLHIQQHFPKEKLKDLAPELREKILMLLSSEYIPTHNLSANTFKFLCHNISQLRVPELQQLSQNTVKEAVQGCSDLSILDLSGYWKMGANTLSEVLRSCTQLKVLNLSGCTQVNQDVIQALVESSAKTLRKLHLGKCRKLTDKALKSIAHLCTNLTDINLQSCRKVSDFSVKPLLQNVGTHLTSLNLSWTKLTDTAFKIIMYKCKYLKKLDLSWCIEISDGVVQSIVKSCTNLQYLSLRRCRISNRTIQEISLQLPLLNFLDISGCDRLTSAISFSLKNCINLSEFKFGGLHLVDSFNETFTTGTFTKLVAKNCSGIGESLIPIVLRYQPMLAHLNVSNTKFQISTLYREFVARQFANLQSVSVVCESGDNTSDQDAVLLQIVKSCPNLTKLNISNWSLITEKGFEQMAKTLNSKLKKLKLTDCKLNNGALSKIAKNCTNLTKLVLSGVKTLSDPGIQHLVTNCKLLTILDLSYCKVLTENSVNSIANSNCCNRLRYLKLRGCTQMGDNTLSIIGEGGKFQNLRSLDILGCNNVSKKILEWFGQRRPLTQIIHDLIKPSKYVLLQDQQNQQSPIYDFKGPTDVLGFGKLLPESFAQQLDVWNSKLNNSQMKKNHSDAKESVDSIKQATNLSIELKYHLGEEFEVYQQLGNAIAPKQII